MPRRNILYKRVYHSLCTRIFSGQIKPGEKLPAMLDLADEFRVSIITIRSTFKLLQELGLIRVSRGKEAVVIYDRENIRSKERLCQWVKNREKVINDVFQLTATILPNTLAFGATLVEPEDVEKLQIITERIESQREEPGALSLALVEFYSVLSELTKNDSFDSLMTACDAFSSMTMVAASQSDSFRSSYCAILRDYMPGVLARIHEDQRVIAKYIRGNILSIAALTADYMAELTAGFDVTEQISLEWSLYSELSLHSEIANDLILRVSTGEFFDGDHLPSEQRLQEEYGTSSKTIRRAILALNEHRIVKTINGIGTVVTFLSLDNVEMLPSDDVSEYTRYFNALQLILLNTASICTHGFPTLTEAQIETTHQRIQRLLSSPNKEYYSCVGILLDVAIRDCPHELTRQVMQQFNTCLFLSCHRRRFATDLFRNVQETSLPYVRDALACLPKRNSVAFGEDILIILQMLHTASASMCKTFHIPADTPTP